jgi:hypothetical protein
LWVPSGRSSNSIYALVQDVGIHIRLACLADIPKLASLIPESVKTLQASYYTPAQIDRALGTVFCVDSQLIQDKTYFVAESASQNLTNVEF